MKTNNIVLKEVLDTREPTPFHLLNRFTLGPLKAGNFRYGMYHALGLWYGTPTDEMVNTVAFVRTALQFARRNRFVIGDVDGWQAMLDRIESQRDPATYHEFKYQGKTIRCYADKSVGIVRYDPKSLETYYDVIPRFTSAAYNGVISAEDLQYGGQYGWIPIVAKHYRMRPPKPGTGFKLQGHEVEVEEIKKSLEVSGFLPTANNRSVVSLGQTGRF